MWRRALLLAALLAAPIAAQEASEVPSGPATVTSPASSAPPEPRPTAPEPLAPVPPESAGDAAATDPDPPPAAPDQAAPEPADPAAEAAGADAGDEVVTPVWEQLRMDDADYAACLGALRDYGTAFSEAPPVTDPDAEDCGIARPVSVTEIVPGVALRPDALMRCETARALAEWVADFVQPAARTLPDRGALTALEHGTAYLCRRRNNAPDGKISEHGFGNAIDVMAFRFAAGEPIPVQPRMREGTREEAFQRAARATACLSFSTVLGPGTDAAHADHLHLDVLERRGGFRLCQ